MSKQDFAQVFDYIKETKVMLCAFTSIDDFIAIDPVHHLQLDEALIKDLNLGEEEQSEIMEDLKRYSRMIDSDSSENLGALRMAVCRLLDVLRVKEQYQLFRLVQQQHFRVVHQNERVEQQQESPLYLNQS
jgi:hypothetical protein